MQIDPTHFSARVRALRELRGWTQSEFSRITGLSQAMVSSIETSSRAVSLDQVQAIAAATGTPELFFVIAPEELSDDELHYRKRSRARITATRTFTRKFKEARHVARVLAANFQAPVKISPVEGSVSPEDIEDIATDVRRSFGIGPNEPIRNMIRCCERAGYPISPIAPIDGADSDHSGLSYTSSDEFGSITYQSGEPGDRQRMTVAHELSHRILHSKRSIAPKQREQEAFKLAGALLFPRHAATESMSESLSLTGYLRLKAEWGLSVQALIMRAGDLGVVDADRKSSLMRQISKKGWRSHEPVGVGIEQPALLWHLATARFGEDPYRAASAELGYSRMDLIEWIPRPTAAQDDDTVTDHSNVIDLSARFRR